MPTTMHPSCYYSPHKVQSAPLTETSGPGTIVLVAAQHVIAAHNEHLKRGNLAVQYRCHIAALACMSGEQLLPRKQFMGVQIIPKAILKHHWPGSLLCLCPARATRNKILSSNTGQEGSSSITCPFTALKHSSVSVQHLSKHC